jgi:CheY-like chemotaxis protein
MLVDDNHDDNFIHERAIRQEYLDIKIITRTTGEEGLNQLRLTPGNENIVPDLIFLDINMPGMNGWEFLAQYDMLEKSMQSKAIIVMLSTSNLTEDIARAKSWSFVSTFITKPLTREKMNSIGVTYFNHAPTTA